jgi:hypothetical protein
MLMPQNKASDYFAGAPDIGFVKKIVVVLNFVFC